MLPAWLPLPAGYDRTTFAAAVVEYTRPPDGFLQEIGVLENFEYFGRCAWYGEWLSADAAGDTARRDAASTVLTQSAAWPSTVATDGGGIVDTLKGIAAAAAVGDSGPLVRDNQINCPVTPIGSPR